MGEEIGSDGVESVDMYSNLSVSLQTRAGVQDLGYSATSVKSEYYVEHPFSLSYKTYHTHRWVHKPRNLVFLSWPFSLYIRPNLGPSLSDKRVDFGAA